MSLCVPPEESVLPSQAHSQSFLIGGFCTSVRKIFWLDHAHFHITTPSLNYKQNNDLASSCNAAYEEGRESMKMSFYNLLATCTVFILYSHSLRH